MSDEEFRQALIRQGLLIDNTPIEGKPTLYLVKEEDRLNQVENGYYVDICDIPKTEARLFTNKDEALEFYYSLCEEPRIVVENIEDKQNKQSCEVASFPLPGHSIVTYEKVKDGVELTLDTEITDDDVPRYQRYLADRALEIIGSTKDREAQDE